MIRLDGLHILLTYTCNYECDHCFVWGSPWQSGVFTLDRLTDLLDQAQAVGTITEVYFEGGEPFLYYALLRAGVSMAHERGFRTGIVSNAYWATSERDAHLWLEPLAEAGLEEIDVSTDLYHGSSMETPESVRAAAAARALGVATAAISVEPPGGPRDPEAWEPGKPLTGGGVMYRGRAAEVLVYDQPGQPWRSFTSCPYENLADPGRIHVDPFGNLHLCQGIVIGNCFERPLAAILAAFEPGDHPIAGPLIAGGPAKLIKKYHLDLPHSFVDACHACYTARLALRDRFPAALQPDQMYGVV